MEVSPATSAAVAFTAAPVPPSRAPGGGVSSAGGTAALPTPEDLHPALWRAHQLGRAREAACASGYPELDAVLPGGGWPVRALTELLLPHAGLGEIRLVAPALAALQARQRGVMLFDPPALPFGWALHACGLDVRQLYVVNSRTPLRGPARGLLPAADVLWALEQSLKCGHLGAVVAWLPARLPADALRRLQLAAQAHEGLAFLLRDAAYRSQPSPAPLRLLLSMAGPDLLRVSLRKRRGPPLAQALELPLPPVLSAPAMARAMRRAGIEPAPVRFAHAGSPDDPPPEATTTGPTPAPPPSAPPAPSTSRCSRSPAARPRPGSRSAACCSTSATRAISTPPARARCSRR